MTRARWWGLIASLLCIGGGLLWWAAPRPSASAEVQIADALQEMADAARRGSVDGVMAYVSDDFKAGSIDRRRLRLLLMRSRESGRSVDYDVRVTPPKVLPATRPDERVVMSRLTVFETLGGETLWGADGLTFVMRRESRRHLLVFTVPQWRVLSVPNLPPLPFSE